MQSMGMRSDETTRPLSEEALLQGYRPPPGTVDEMMGTEGRPRPLWRGFLSSIAQLSDKELAVRCGRADQYLRDSGVFYRVYGEDAAQDRGWPLSHIPVLIDEAEWTRLSKGIIQRADLLEAVLQDIYGDNKLVGEGHIPPSLIAGSPEYLRPLVGVKPVGGHFLHFCAFELGRGPDGQWWVLGDRTQAPSGAGFALENRVATVRAFNDIHADMNVHRIAGFFRDFRDALEDMRPRHDDRVIIMTPGQHNETYYEHAYIARYLGFTLLEGEDITVVDREVRVRTVSGLRPISVLWRRLDAAYMDPLELNPTSQLGTPGMVEAVRQGNVAIVNALGAGLMENRALAAFLPAICSRLLGEEPVLPSIATWWCGQPGERDHVIGNLDHMMVGPALSSRLHFEDVANTLAGASLTGAERDALIARIRNKGAGLVSQEVVTLSTTPVFQDGRLKPRPVSMRVFAARTQHGWTVMPGGFARVGSSADVSAIAMQRGGQAADVWIVSPGPVDSSLSLLSDHGTDSPRRLSGLLPSRAADNLFWLGRYVERAEDMMRILRAYHARLAEAVSPDTPLLNHSRRYMDMIGIAPQPALPEGLIRTLEASIRSASHIRDRFSPDGWSALDDLAVQTRQSMRLTSDGDEAVRALTVLLRQLAGFSGLIHENMYRFTGWRFLEMGRFLERALHMTRLLTHMTQDGLPPSALDMVVEIGDSVITHRRRYKVGTARNSVLALMVLDARNPRSVVFQLDNIRQEFGHLPPGLKQPGHQAPMREMMRLHTHLAIRDPEDIDHDFLIELSRDLAHFSNLLTREYFR